MSLQHHLHEETVCSVLFSICDVICSITPVIFMISNVVNSLLDVTALLSCLLSVFALMGPRCNYQHVHLNRFHSALIKPGVCCDPCLRAMLVNLPRGHAFLL